MINLEFSKQRLSQHFSIETRTNCIVYITVSSNQRYAYKKDYSCQRASKHKRLTTEQRNKNCFPMINLGQIKSLLLLVNTLQRTIK